MTERRRTGIFLTRNGAEATLAKRGRLARRPTFRTVTQEADGDLWGADDVPLSRLMRDLARALPTEARRADCPTAIAIPDPLVTEERLTFQDFPQTPNEARALVRFRVATDHRKNPDDLAVAWQVMGSKAGRTDVLVRTLPAPLLARTQQAARRAGYFVDRIDGWSGFWPEPAMHDGTAAQVWGGNGWWAVACEAEETGATAFRAGWLDDIGAATSQIARTARAFMLNAKSEGLSLTPLGSAGDIVARLDDGSTTLAGAQPLDAPSTQVALG